MSGTQLTDKHFYVAVKALLFYNNKFLILKRSKKSNGEFGFWEFPGGRLEFFEDPMDGLKREIQEEAGVDIDIKFPLGVWDHKRNNDMHVIGITFLAKAISDEIVLSDEHLEYKWITKEEFADYKVFPKMLEEIDEWNWDNIARAL